MKQVHIRLSVTIWLELCQKQAAAVLYTTNIDLLKYTATGNEITKFAYKFVYESINDKLPQILQWAAAQKSRTF